MRGLIARLIESVGASVTVVHPKSRLARLMTLALCLFAGSALAKGADVQSACSEQGVNCRTYTPLAFDSKNGVYHVGYLEENRRLPPGAHRPPDSFDSHRIPLRHPEEDIHDVDHYSVYRLCYDYGADNGTNQCRQMIEPQPEIGQIHPEVRDPKRKPYNILFVKLDGINKEIGADRAQYLVVKLWMQENREPTSEEKRRFEEKWNREQRDLPQAAVPMCPWEECDPRFRPELPTSRFTLRYRFVASGEKASFEVADQTEDVIKSIRNKTTLWKE